MTNWIDFKQVKELATVELVVAHYGLQVKPAKGSELVGLCPFHEEKTPSFKMNTKKRAFNCFGCGAHGNMLDFIARKENVSVKKAAQLVLEWLGSGAVQNEAPRANKSLSGASEEPKGSKEAHEPNKPLGFKLKLQHDHPYLKGRGISPELAEEFGLGYCNKGLLKGRIAIPIYNESGELVAYAGRWVEGPLPDGEEKYKLPPGFHKLDVLYNLQSVVGNKHLVIVEGFFSVIRLCDLGIPAVALMGTVLSEAHEELLRGCGIHSVTLMLDGNKAGREATEKILPRLAKQFSVRAIELPEDAQPDTLDEKALLNLLGRGESHE